MTAHATEILPAGTYGSLDIHGTDLETQAVVGFLSRYANPGTRANYELDLKQFRAFITRPPCNRLTLLTVNRTDVNLYLLDMQRRGLAEATVARRTGTLRTFYKYAVIDELIEKDPTVHVEIPPVDHDKQRRTWLTTLQFAQLLHHARRNTRDHAMVVSMGMLGLRIGEMCSLQVTDVHRLIGAAEIRFVGKGSKAATMDLPLEALHAYDVYAAGRTDGALFLTWDGNPWRQNDARRRLEVLVRHAGLVGVDITPHGLRRTAARTLQERGIELGAIQQFLRHASPTTTAQCYIGRGGGAASLARATLASIYGQMSA